VKVENVILDDGGAIQLQSPIQALKFLKVCCTSGLLWKQSNPIYAYMQSLIQLICVLCSISLLKCSNLALAKDQFPQVVLQHL